MKLLIAWLTVSALGVGWTACALLWTLSRHEPGNVAINAICLAVDLLWTVVAARAIAREKKPRLSDSDAFLAQLAAIQNER